MLRRISFATRREPIPQVNISIKITTKETRNVKGSELVTAEGVEEPLLVVVPVAAGAVVVDECAVWNAIGQHGPKREWKCYMTESEVLI